MELCWKPARQFPYTLASDICNEHEGRGPAEGYSVVLTVSGDMCQQAHEVANKANSKQSNEASNNKQAGYM
jgi:hypothetical protein